MADLSLGRVVVLGWVGVAVKVGLVMVLLVLLLVVLGVESLDPLVGVKVMVPSLLAVTGAMLLAVLGVHWRVLVMLGASLVMLCTDGVVYRVVTSNRFLSWGERESGGLLDMS